MYDEQLYMCMFLLQCILLQHYVLPFYFLYMFMRLLVCLVNAMDRVLLAGRRHGDVTVNGIRAPELQQWASMGHESAGTYAKLLPAQQKSDWKLQENHPSA